MFESMEKTILLARYNVDGAVEEYDAIFESAEKELAQAKRYRDIVYKDLCSTYSTEEANRLIDTV